MAAVNTSVSVVEIKPTGGVPNSGWRFGNLDSVAKASQNDILTIKNAKEIGMAMLADDATGVIDAVTISGVEITMTDANAGAHSGFLVYR